MRADTVSSCDTRGQPRRVRCPTLSTPAARSGATQRSRDPGAGRGRHQLPAATGGTTSWSTTRARRAAVLPRRAGLPAVLDQIRERGTTAAAPRHGHCALLGQSVEIDFPAPIRANGWCTAATHTTPKGA